MDSKTRFLLSLLPPCLVVGLILLLYLVTGQITLVDQLLQSTAEGDLGGIAFTAGGPFAMFVISYLLLYYSSDRIGALGAIKLYLYFPELVHPVGPPSQPADFDKAICWYKVFSDDEEIKPREEANIRFQDMLPYIYVSAPKIENPEFQVRLEYNGHEWISDSFTPKTGRVPLR